MRLAVVLLSIAGAAWGGQTADAPPDPVLAAMEAELERSRSLRLAELEAPYFIEYTLEDVHSFSVSATLGAIISNNQNRFRAPGVQVRVGGYEFDNTNYVLTELFSRPGGSGGGVPLEDHPEALRAYFWLATDAAYKGALEAIARKRAAVRNLTVREETPDFWKAEPVRLLEPVNVRPPEEAGWVDRVRELSAVFRGYPAIFASQVDYGASLSVSRLVNTEGTRIQYPDPLHWMRVRAEGQAGDGMPVRDAATVVWQDAALTPAATELGRTVEEVARNARALVNAALGENYVGPVLFESIAAPQLLAQLLGRNLSVPRRPVTEPGRTPPVEPSEFEDRSGSRVLPDWMDVVDDPTQAEWRGRRLLGHYRVDMEGVTAQPVRLVERGILKGFLLTRQPVKGASGSNGHGRLPGAFGAKMASISNLFVSASESITARALRQNLIELCRQRGKPYGLVVRKLDFPSSGDLREIRRMASGARQRGGGGRLVSRPLLVYRVLPDGTEELVRGLEFRGVSARLLRDIVAASDESHLFEYLANTAPLSLSGVSGYVAGCSVVAPSLLFEEMELERSREQYPRPPTVPPPPLLAAR